MQVPEPRFINVTTDPSPIGGLWQVGDDKLVIGDILKDEKSFLGGESAEDVNGERFLLE